MPDQSHIMKCGNVEIDFDMLTITLNGTETRVSPKDMEVLKCLTDQQGRLVSRDFILEQVWPDVVVNSEAVSLSISRLRAAFGESAKSPQWIQTIPTKGYRFVQSATARIPRTKNIVIVGLTAALVVLMFLFLTLRTEYQSISTNHIPVPTQKQ